MLMSNPRSKKLAENILAIHNRDHATLKRNRYWVSTAWLFVKDSIERVWWPYHWQEQAEWEKELKRLDPLRKVVAPYLKKRAKS